VAICVFAGGCVGTLAFVLFDVTLGFLFPFVGGLIGFLAGIAVSSWLTWRTTRPAGRRDEK
jgi:hypothetical protein